MSVNKIVYFFLFFNFGFLAYGRSNYQFSKIELKQSYSECVKCHTKNDAYIIKSAKTLTRAHKEINLHHGNKLMSCNLCHDKSNHNHLTNATGEKISFTSPSLVCSTCHFDVFKDWEEGRHGLVKGGWNKLQTQTQCIHCHKSHDVSFKQMKASPPPKRPKFLILKN